MSRKLLAAIEAVFAAQTALGSDADRHALASRVMIHAPDKRTTRNLPGGMVEVGMVPTALPVQDMLADLLAAARTCALADDMEGALAQVFTAGVFYGRAAQQVAPALEHGSRNLRVYQQVQSALASGTPLRRAVDDAGQRFRVTSRQVRSILDEIDAGLPEAQRMERPRRKRRT
jgi:hypothetical protein